MKNDTILIIIPTLTIGGAETFAMRLAQALVKQNINAKLFVLRGDLINKELVGSIAPDVEIFYHKPMFLSFIQKIDGLLFTLHIDFSLLRFLETKRLKQVVQKENVSIMHSNLFTSDLIVSKVSEELNIPCITTVHGDYFGYNKTKNYKASRLIDFDTKLKEVQKGFSHIVCITDKQIDLMKSLLRPFGSEHKVEKIYNGYETNVVKEKKLTQIPEEDFVIGMVARGIKEKGWDVLISAFEKANLDNTWLVLVGDGEEIQNLKKSCHNDKIIFTGNVTDPINYISRFDIGCLPSRYSSESLPTSLIEYMYCQVPTIATDVGEIPSMLDIDTDRPSGLLICSENIEKTEDELVSALQKLYHDKQLYQNLKANTTSAFKKFDMNSCTAKYITLYQRAMHE